jgi:hypothetical protein
VAGGEPARGGALGAIRERLGVPHASRSRHHDAGTGDPGPPRQAEVVREEVDRLVEAADLREAVGAHEREPAGDREDVAQSVVLALVQFAPLHVRKRHTHLVDREPELGEPARVVPLDELGTDEVGVQLLGGGDHGADRPRVGRGVVVAEHVELRAGDEVEHDVGRGAEADAAGGVRRHVVDLGRR